MVFENNDEDGVADDTDYIATDVPARDINDNDRIGSNENDDGYDVGIEDEDDGSH